MRSSGLSNPWWFLTGAVGGGLAWAVGLPVWVAAVIGVIIWLTTMLVFGFLFAAPAPSAAVDPPVPSGADPDAECADRARTAASSFAELAAPLFAGPLADHARRMVWRADEIAASIDHLAGRSAQIAHRLDGLADHSGGHEWFQHARARHGEVRHRMHAATGDLEAATARLAPLVSPQRSAPATDAVDTLLGELENIGYGVDIGERLADEILNGDGNPPSPVAG